MMHHGLKEQYDACESLLSFHVTPTIYMDMPVFLRSCEYPQYLVKLMYVHR